MNPKPEFFTYRSRRIAYYKDGHGKPLILLHGWGSCSEWMFSLAKSLSGIRTCIFLDFPGFGASEEMAEAWSLNDYRALIRHFMSDTLQITQADILVHSFGCRVLLPMLASENEQKMFGKVIVTGGAGLKPKRTLTFYAKSWLVKVLKAPYSLLPPEARERGLAKLRQGALWRRLGSGDYQKLSGPMRESFVKTVTDHLDHLLPEINHEILLVWGDRDDATPLWMGEKLEAEIPGAVLITVQGGGHYAFLDKPDHFQAIVRAYLSG